MKKYYFLLLIAFAFLPLFSEAENYPYTAPGTYTFTVPAGVSTVTATIAGAGGGGGGATMSGDYWTGGGGGSGGYVTQDISVTAGQQLTIVVGAGGCAGRYYYFGTDRWAETGVDWTSATYHGCPAGQYSGGNGGASSVGSVSAAGGHGGDVGLEEWGLDHNDGAGGSPSGVAGTPGVVYQPAPYSSELWYRYCDEVPDGKGPGGYNGLGGTGGDGMGCSNGTAQYGQNGSVNLTWTADIPTPTVTLQFQ
ncbi:MAG: hypothetical protein Q7S01_06525 [bacterium]|nr:hypothetical protein [bacterium]